MEFDITYNFINIPRGWASRAHACNYPYGMSSQVVFSWSYEGQLPKPNLFLTSSIFTSIQSKSLLQLSGPSHLQGVETVAGFCVSPTYMGCPSSHASNFFRIKGAAHSRATRRRKLAGRRAHSRTSSLWSQGPASAQEPLLQTSQLCFSSLQLPALLFSEAYTSRYIYFYHSF